MSILECLHTLVIEPIISYLPTDPEIKVIFSPCEMLNTVPFGALWNPERGFLIERHTIGMIPSFRVLNWCEDRLQELQSADLVPGEGAIVAVGDPVYKDLRKWCPLSKTAEEVEFLAHLSPSRVKTLLRSEVTPRDVLRCAKVAADHNQTQALIHIAMHGIVDSNEFEKGALILSAPCHGAIKSYGEDATAVCLRPNSEFPETFLSSLTQLPSPNETPLHFEEHLRSEDIIECGFKHSMISSSANGIINSEGIFNLPRAFMLVGVPSVVVSQWKVDDGKTLDLMRLFYTHWHKDGIDVTSALRLAMCELMTGKHTDDVRKCQIRHWAPFVVWGSPSACFSKSLL